MSNEKISEMLGRTPSLIPVTYKGVKGYIPEYFNYNSRNDLYAFFSESKEDAYEKLYQYLKEKGDGSGAETANKPDNGQEN